MLKLIIISIIILIFNIPFGYWRANVHKFSWQWVLAIHIPVPFIISIRIFEHVGFAWYTYVFFVAAFFTGQKLGGLIHHIFLNKFEWISSCLIWDLVKMVML